MLQPVATHCSKCCSLLNPQVSWGCGGDGAGLPGSDHLQGPLTLVGLVWLQKEMQSDQVSVACGDPQ